MQRPGQDPVAKDDAPWWMKYAGRGLGTVGSISEFIMIHVMCDIPFYIIYNSSFPSFFYTLHLTIPYYMYVFHAYLLLKYLIWEISFFQGWFIFEKFFLVSFIYMIISA